MKNVLVIVEWKEVSLRFMILLINQIKASATSVIPGTSAMDFFVNLSSYLSMVSMSNWYKIHPP